MGKARLVPLDTLAARHALTVMAASDVLRELAAQGDQDEGHKPDATEEDEHAVTTAVDEVETILILTENGQASVAALAEAGTLGTTRAPGVDVAVA